MSDSEEELPLCRYGAKCYQTNPAHRKAYAHPSPPNCKHGSKCTDTTTSHRNKYSHPTPSDEDSTPAKKKTTPSPAPKEEDVSEEEETPSLSASVSVPSQAACAFGEYCLRTNKDHRREFTHPKKTIVGFSS